MRSTLSPMFTGSKMRQMYGHVANVGQQTTKTMKENILTGEENLIEFKELATKFTVDVRLLVEYFSINLIFLQVFLFSTR